jgi:hypothetical protein
MRRLTVSLLGALFAFLSGYSVSSAAEVPDSRSSAGPAIVGFGDRLALAWAGEAGISTHLVWYSFFDGASFTPEALVPGALTTSAPALAVANQKLYLATTPPDTADKIYYRVAQGRDFVGDSAPLCDEETCARTRAAPALLGDGTILYAAWTTPDGQIMYAMHSNGAWHIDARPIPNAKTSPTTGPTLALYHNRVHISWVAPSGEAVEVATGTVPVSITALPATSLIWSQPIEIPAATKVAPALGVFTLETPPVGAVAAPSNVLFLAWTTADATIDFARLDAATGRWAPSDPPVALPAGPLTIFPVAVGGFTHSVDGECFRTDSLSLTSKKNPPSVEELPSTGVHTPCP